MDEKRSKAGLEEMETEAVKRWMEKRKKKTEPDDDFLIRLEEMHIPVERTPSPRITQS